MHSAPCDALKKQGYQFFSTVSAAVKPCMWCKRSLKAATKVLQTPVLRHSNSHRCVQMTPTSGAITGVFSAGVHSSRRDGGEETIEPSAIVGGLKALQKKALSRGISIPET